MIDVREQHADIAVVNDRRNAREDGVENLFGLPRLQNQRVDVRKRRQRLELAA